MSDHKNHMNQITTKQGNSSKLIITHLTKLYLLCDQIKGNIDILMISRTKIDDSFPIGNFLIDGFSTSF